MANGAGRKRKATKLHLIDGTARADRTNLREPKPVRGYPRCPNGAPKNVQRAYRRLGRIYDDMGVLTEADGPALYLMATVQAEVEELEKFLITENRTYETSSRYCDKLVKVRPEVAQLAAGRTLLRSLIAEFGGTPASRGRVSTTEGNAGKSNPWDKLKNRGR